MATEQHDVIADPKVSPPSSVGFTLKTSREAMGKDLSEVAAQLRIRQPYLAALEDGRHKDLPGGTYAVGFLRTYAEFLSLDGEEMVRRFRQEAAGDLNSRAELIFPSPVTEGRVPGGALLFLGLVVAGLAYGGWYWVTSRDATIAEIVPPIPERMAPAVRPAEPAAPPVSASEESKEPEPAAAAPGTDAPPPAETAEDKTVVAEAPAAAPVPQSTPEPEPAKQPEAVPPAEAVAEAPPPPAAAKAVTEEAADSRVVLKAAGDDCWVQVREMDGQLLLSRLLRKGDTYRVPDRPGLTLMVGNAGALEISVDGKSVPSLGAPGQVRRDIKLDPDKLVAGG